MIPVVPFLSDDPAYCLGVEAGLLFARMNAKEPEINGTYHRKNDEQLFLMAHRLRYRVHDWTPLDETWFTARFVCLEETAT